MESEWFADRLRELRTAKGWSQKQLAEAAGIGLGVVFKLEQDVHAPTWPTVVALCKALGVGCDVFMQPPADREPHGRGRPPKPVEEPAEPAPKRPRGRPKKGS